MKNDVHVVLDLETMSTDKQALVLSIGWAIIKDCEIVSQGEVRPKMEAQADRHVSFDTLRWWMDGNKAEAQKHLASLPEWDLDVALTYLDVSVDAIKQWPKVKVWGNSPNFDCDILAGLYRSAGKEVPWKFWQERDMRTLRDVSTTARHVPKIAHTAMWDAVAEAEDLCAYLKSI